MYLLALEKLPRHGRAPPASRHSRLRHLLIPWVDGKAGAEASFATAPAPLFYDNAQRHPVRTCIAVGHQNRTLIRP